MRVHVDLDLCQSHGQCVFAAPDVFSFDEDDLLRYVPSADESRRDAVIRAAEACPVRAISVESPHPSEAAQRPALDDARRLPPLQPRRHPNLPTPTPMGSGR
jgi:ferredoxin